MAEQTKKAWYKKWWVWVIAVLVLAGIGGAMSGGGTAETQGAEQSSQKQEQSSQQTESPTPVASIVYDAELGSGNYTSGIDFPAGTYDIEAVSYTHLDVYKRQGLFPSSKSGANCVP